MTGGSGLLGADSPRSGTLRAQITGLPFTVAGMDIILIAGLWLRRSVWTAVATELERRGHRPIPLSLPGVDDTDPDATLSDQAAAVLASVDAAQRPLVVGHSAASTLAWIAADQRPEAVAQVVMVGGFPATDGAAYADFFDIVNGAMPFPGWEPFAGPDSVDLDDAQRAQIADDAVPVREGVAKGVVHLGDDRRFQVPVLLVCPEYSPEQAKEWIAAGELPELQRAAHVAFADIDSGHWPMITAPGELAALLHEATRPT
jgi:pimeloyl-ACP methyl ester carboxylesterase